MIPDTSNSRSGVAERNMVISRYQSECVLWWKFEISIFSLKEFRFPIVIFLPPTVWKSARNVTCCKKKQRKLELEEFPNVFIYRVFANNGPKVFVLFSHNMGPSESLCGINTHTHIFDKIWLDKGALTPKSFAKIVCLILNLSFFKINSCPRTNLCKTEEWDYYY